MHTNNTDEGIRKYISFQLFVLGSLLVVVSSIAEIRNLDGCPGGCRTALVHCRRLASTLLNHKLAVDLMLRRRLATLCCAGMPAGACNTSFQVLRSPRT